MLFFSTLIALGKDKDETISKITSLAKSFGHVDDKGSIRELVFSKYLNLATKKRILKQVKASQSEDIKEEEEKKCNINNEAGNNPTSLSQMLEQRSITSSQIVSNQISQLPSPDVMSTVSLGPLQKPSDYSENFLKLFSSFESAMDQLHGIKMQQASTMNRLNVLTHDMNSLQQEVATFKTSRTQESNSRNVPRGPRRGAKKK